MREYRITEEQLEELASINNETADEARRSDEIVAQVKAQLLVPVEKMRQAFQDNYVKTQDQLQQDLLKQAQTQRSPEEIAKLPTTE